MSTDYEEAVIAFAQSLEAPWGDAKAREKCRRRLQHLLTVEYDDTQYGIAMLRIIQGCARDAGMEG